MKDLKNFLKESEKKKKAIGHFNVAETRAGVRKELEKIEKGIEKEIEDIRKVEKKDKRE